MVVPGLSSSLMHHEDGYSSTPEGPSSLKASKAQYMQNETAHISTLAAIDAQPETETNGTCIDGHTHGFLKHGNIIEEPKTELEGFIMRENDVDVIQEPVAEKNSFVKGAPDGYKDLQPLVSSDGAVHGVTNESFALQKRRVQWSDNNGKELFQVLEYEASDTGDSEDDEDDVDTHACTCTIQ